MDKGIQGTNGKDLPCRKDRSGGSVSLYVHIPFCTVKCNYCAFYSEPISRHNPAELVDCLVQELDRTELDSNEHIETIYIGGGSPSCLPQPLLDSLIHAITTRFGCGKEFTIEVNPGQATDSMLDMFVRSGVNRISIGAQSFENKQLTLLGRCHTCADTIKAVESAKRAGFSNISIDLIFALPGSDIDSWRHSLERAVELEPKHISAYGLSYEKATPFLEALAAGKIVALDQQTELEMYETAMDTLEAASFEHYEISNFAKRGFRCMHNVACWRNNPYIGIGPAAASYHRSVRYSNIADIDGYNRVIRSGRIAVICSEKPSAIQRACETAVLNLRMADGIDIADFKEQTGFDVLELFAAPIELHERSGNIKVAQGRVFLTRSAFPIADMIACDFSDVYV